METPPADKPLTAVSGTPDDVVVNIRFLYDKRLTLFNTRRDHEWKIYFGALALLGAADAAVVTGNIILTGWWRWGWLGVCLLVFAVVFGYERDLQIRNRGDRRAMDQLFNRLCDLVGIEDTQVVELSKPPSWWSSYGWAFPWQMILLLLAVTVSALLPLAK